VFQVSTCNVNGIRAAARKGFVAWLAATESQVVCLQETRADPSDLTDELREPDGWHTVHAESATKGRNGVALLTRDKPTAVRVGFGEAEFERSGRYLEADLPNGVTVASLYLPSGEVGTARQEEKLRFITAFLPYLAELRAKAATDGREVLVCGDWNIAHHEIDLRNWKTNQRTAGFTPEERAWLGRVYDEAGYVDVVRALHPEGPGPYTWWTYRGRAYDNDAGWRIDLHVATPALAARAVSAVVERAPSHDTRWSDHAPVTVVYAD
jgi:exodeoxyribonuclease-3